MTEKEGRLHNNTSQKAGSVLKGRFVLRIKFSVGRQFNASKSPHPGVSKPLSATLTVQTQK